MYNNEVEIKARLYADELIESKVKGVIVDAYLEGYKESLKDLGKSKAVFDGDGIEYVDLGLPSGTLWSSDYLKKDNKILYLSYDEAKLMRVPTQAQWSELQSKCEIKYYYKGGTFDLAKCTGPNGNVINILVNDTINEKGDVEDEPKVCRFWTLEGSVNYAGAFNSAEIGVWFEGRMTTGSSLFSPAYNLAVRLVR